MYYAFSNEDKVLTNNLYKFEKYSSPRILAEFFLRINSNYGKKWSHY